ncbi:MAG: hypothetical protein Q9161_003679 [Pseudevernia consocians]
MSSSIPADENAKIHADGLAKRLKNWRYSYSEGNSKRYFTTRQRLVDHVWLQTDTFAGLFTRTRWSSTEYQELRLHFPRVLSILVEIGWPELDTAFKSLFFDNPKRTDESLPFSNDELGFLDQTSRQSFRIIQHAYAPFVIGDGGREVELPSEKVLPFEADPESIGGGCFSKVYKVKIPTGCYMDSDSRNQKRFYRESHCLAFKQLYHRADYKREVSNLKVFSNSLKSHKNIAQYIQAVSQGDRFRIFFPFADHGSLEDLFKKPIPDDLSITCQSLMYSLHDLMEGVAFIHDAMFVRQDESGSYKYGAHLDLKLANILIFPNPKGVEGAGVWTITDFGISSFKDVNDRITSQGPCDHPPSTCPNQISRMTGPRDQLGTYCPPELHPRKKVPFRGYQVDMWSIGCISADVLCFALDGEGCITRFRNERTAKNFEDDYFFEVFDPDQSCVFAVKSAVADFLENLLVAYPKQRRWVKECILIICDVLRLEPDDRSPAKEVSRRLSDLTFDENGDDPLEPWDKECLGTKWDTNPPRRPSTLTLAVQTPQTLIGHDRQISTNVLGDKADQSPHATGSQIPKECAINLDKVKACEFLIKAGADTSLEDSFGSSATDYAYMAAFENRLAPTTLQYLRNDIRFFLRDKDDPNFLDVVEKYQFSKIHCLVLGILPTSQLKDELDVTPETVVNQTDADGKTPLLWASRRGDLEAVRLLLQHGADANIADMMLRSPLHMACRAKSVPIIRLLIKNKADPRATNFVNEMPAHYACYENDGSSLLEPFLDEGINVNALSKYDRSLLDIVVDKDFSKATQYLIDSGASVVGRASSDWPQRPLGKAVSCQAHKSAPVLLRRGCDVGFVDSQRQNILHIIAEYGNLKIVDCMRSLRLGAEYADQRDKLGRTPLDVAKLREKDESFQRAFGDLVGDIRDQDFPEKYEDAMS